MAYDQGLAERIRGQLEGHPGVTEKAMFGGVCWLRDGKMFVGIVGHELMARVGPEAHDTAVARPHARVMDFTGRPMRGYVFVDQAGLGADEALAGWIDECERHVATLPAKKAAKPRPRGTAARKTPRRRTR